MGNRQSDPNQQKNQNQKQKQLNFNKAQSKKQIPNQSTSTFDPYENNIEMLNATMSQIGYHREQIQNNEEDDFYDDIKFYSGGDEAAPSDNDIRVPHYQAYCSYPFNSNVRVISVFKEIPTSKPREFQFGSGFALNPRVVFTVAHNVWEKDIKKTPDYIFVEPETEHEEKKLIRVQKFGIHRIYYDQSNPEKEQFDLCILILQENDIIKPSMTMKLKQNYNFGIQRDRQIILAGFPKDRNEENPNRCIQYYCTKKIESRSKNFMNYSHMTSGGQSGAPLIMKLINAEGNAEYVVIGLHKGCKGKSYGILTTTQNRNEIVEIARALAISKPNSPAEIQSKKEETQSLIKSIEILQKEKNSASVELKNIIWKKLILKANSLNELVRFNDPSSFQSAITTIEKNLKKSINVSPTSRNQSLLSDMVLNAFFDKLKKASFNLQEQEEYFKFIEEYIDVSLGRTKIENEFEYCGKLGETLYILHNKLFNKPEAEKLNDQNLTLKAMNEKLMKKREQIIQKLQAGYLPIVASKQRQKGRTQRQLNFLLKLSNFAKAQEYIDTKQQQNEKILNLKGFIMKLHGNLKRAKAFYERCKIRMQTLNQRQAKEYLEALTGLGEVYRMRNELNKTFECFNQNLQIRKRINGENSIQYAEALNFVSTFYIEVGNYVKATDELIQALGIAEKHHGDKSHELIKYLSNLAVAYYYRSQFSKSMNYSERTLSIIQATKGKDSLDMIQIMSNMGAALRASKRLREAMEWYKRSLKIQEHHRGEDNFFCGAILNNIGHLYLNMGKVEESQIYIRRSIEVYKKHQLQNQVQNTVGYGHALYNMACILEFQSKFKEAAQLAKRSHQKLKGATGVQHKSVKNAFDLWEKCKKQAK